MTDDDQKKKQLLTSLQQLQLAYEFFDQTNTEITQEQLEMERKLAEIQARFQTKS